MKTKRNQMKRKAITFALIIACCLMTVGTSFAQNVGISNTYITPDPSSMLDVVSTDRGVLIPRMTETQRNAIVNPAMGLQIFNLTTKCLNMWIGTTWKQSCFDCDFNSPVAGNNGPMCQGSVLNLTATSILGATYQWSGPNGFTSTDQNPSIPNATSAASGSYSVTATKNGCTSTPQSTVATVNNTPVTPTAGNSGPVCVNAILNLTASTIVGATYNWTGPNGYSASVQNPIITSAALSHAGTFNVIAILNGCASAAGTTTVTINATPATPGSISGPASACPNSTGNVYTIAAISGATSYNWLVPTGATVTAGATTNSITVTFGSTSGNITVSATNTCGTSALATINITVNALPISTFTNSGSTWPNTSITFTPTTTSGATYSWTFASGSPGGSTNQNPSVTWGSASTYNVSLIVTSSSSGCSSTTTNAITIANPTVQTFTSSTTWTVPTGITTVQVLVVGGGGGGSISSGYSGGGGSGQVVYNSAYSVSPGSITVTVGAGGAAGVSGGNSVFGTITAAAGSGGSGGSGAVSGNGYNGGIGLSCSNANNGGGGGGAGGAGLNGVCNTGAGAGGPGLMNSITGTSTYYGGGGGGGCNNWSGIGAYGGIGGSGGGGKGFGAYNGAATAGTANTGGGGGGSYDSSAGAGGSGVVIIKY